MPAPNPFRYDVFVCHASADKRAFVRRLVTHLQRAGLTVWYDELELRPGRSLRRSIDAGLAESRYGVVVLSPAFFGAKWTEYELNGLTQTLDEGHLLPVWYHVGYADVAHYSPALTDTKALEAKKGLVHVASEIVKVVGPPQAVPPQAAAEQSTPQLSPNVNAGSPALPRQFDQTKAAPPEAQAVHSLARRPAKDFDEPAFDWLHFKIALVCGPDQQSITARWQRRYRIVNASGVPCVVGIRHYHEKPLIDATTVTPSFRRFWLRVQTSRRGIPHFAEWECDLADEASPFAPESLPGLEQLILQGQDAASKNLTLNYRIELPPKARLRADISSDTVFPVDGGVPIVCALATRQLELEVWHEPEIRIDLSRLYVTDERDQLISPRVMLEPQDKHVVKTWVLKEVFSAGQGVQLRWWHAPHAPEPPPMPTTSPF